MRTSDLTVRAIEFVAREKHGKMYLAALACGVSPSTLTRFANGLSVSPDSAKKIESEFGMSRDELLKPLLEAMA